MSGRFHIEEITPSVESASEISKNPVTVSVEGKLEKPIVQEDPIELNKKIDNLTEEYKILSEELRARKDTERDFPGIPVVTYHKDQEVTPKLLRGKMVELRKVKDLKDNLKSKEEKNVSNKIYKALDYIGNTITIGGIAALSLVGFKKKDVPEGEINQSVNKEYRFSEDQIKKGVLTPEEQEKRKQTTAEYLKDSSDITSNESIEKQYEEHRLSTLKEIDKLTQKRDLLLSEKKHSDNKEQIETLNSIIEFFKDSFEEIPKKKSERIKQNHDYLKLRDSLKKDQIDQVYQQYDKEKEWLRNQMQTIEYRDRLIKEFGGDVEKADEVLKARLENLRRDYVIESPQKIIADVSDAAAYYNPLSGTHLPSHGYGNNSYSIHEGQHQATDGSRGITEYAKDLYSKAFDTTNINYKQDYYSRPTELDARKKQLELELEKYGIKKYGEKFTPEHYKKMLELRKKVSLSQGAVDFIDLIKPEYFEKIMNTIALEEIKKENDNQV